MRTQRILTAWAVFLMVTVGVGGTVAYGAYHRSDLYRRDVEEWLAEFFGLPADVGAVRPCTFSSRELADVQIWLPERRDRIFHCPRAVLDTDGNGSGGGTLVLIDDPVLYIGSEAWQWEDYGNVLRAGLAHNFSDIDVGEVRLSRAKIVWPRKDFRMTVEGVEGHILFDASGCGEARLASRSLNGTTVGAPVQIQARIDPDSPDLLTEVTLTVPPIPLQALGLHQILGSAITQGNFAGWITLHQADDGDYVRLSGSATDVKLEELTRRASGGPVAAVVDLNIAEAVLQAEELDRLLFNGEIRQLEVEPLLARFGLPGVGGRARLTVRDARLVREGIEHLSFSGEWLGATVEPLLKRLIGQGGIKGRLLVEVHSLVIRDNKLIQADADVQVLPPVDGPGLIERGLLISLLKDRAGLSIPESLLPPSIEFSQMSARLMVDGRRFRILSRKGSAGPPLITARLLGRDLPLLGEFDQSYDLQPFQDAMRARILEWRSAVSERIRARAAEDRPG